MFVGIIMMIIRIDTPNVMRRARHSTTTEAVMKQGLHPVRGGGGGGPTPGVLLSTHADFTHGLPTPSTIRQQSNLPKPPYLKS